MDPNYIRDFLEALRAELIKFRFKILWAVIAISFFILLIGALLPKRYTTSVVVHVESSRIIEPLLRNNSDSNRVDRSEQASEKIYTRNNMIMTAKKAGLIDDATPLTQQEDVIKYLREGIKITREKFNNQFRVSYTSKNQDESFEVLNAIINAFIEISSKEKQEESAGAYSFIDDQVQNYKRQLEIAETNLKEFNAKNTDGTEASVNARIYALRQEIENLRIAIDEAQAKLLGLDQQLGYEGKYIEARNKVEVLRQKRISLSETLDQLKLNFQDAHPDVIMARAQISDIDKQISQLVAEGRGFAISDKLENPLFEDLRRQYAEAQVDVSTKSRRIESLEELLGQEYVRQERIAENQAVLSELVRDYDVTKKMYDTLVERKESARISMSLDIEGQSVSYRIREPAMFPLQPIGLRFWHLAILGPFVGLFLMLSGIVGYMMVDPRIRTARSLLQQLPEDIVFAGLIPHYRTPLNERLIRRDATRLLTLASLALVIYMVIAIGWHYFYG